jgi:type II secretory pathway component PulF
MKFEYQARTKTGDIKKGVIEAVSKIAAIDLLHKNRLFLRQSRKKRRWELKYGCLDL